MPLQFEPIHGRPAIMRLRRIGTATEKPADVVITTTAEAAVGDKTLQVDALTELIPVNTILTFGGVKVVVTEDAAEAATTLKVEAFEGAAGDGIPAVIPAAAEATWDGLYTDGASNSLDFNPNEQTQELSAVTHGGSTGVKVAVPEVTGISPTVNRQGFMPNRSPLLRDLVRNVKTPNANWWAVLEVPDENGEPLLRYEGLGRVSGVTHPIPADNYVQLNYAYRFIEDDFAADLVDEA